MKASTAITVTARVYRPRGEKSSARLRAYIDTGEYKGVRVSCSRAIREEWEPGDTITAEGAPVDTGAYFKARTVTTTARGAGND